MATSEADSKQRILASATHLFAVNGYHGTGVAQIGDDAGVGRGALYHHMGSKQQLLYEVLSVCADDEMLAFAESVRGSDAPAPEKIRQLSRALMMAIATHRLEWTVFFREAAALEGKYRDDVQRRRDQYEQAWTSVITEGQRAGQLRDLDTVVVNGILGLHNYAYLWLEPQGRLTPEEISDVFCDMLLNGLAVP